MTTPKEDKHLPILIVPGIMSSGLEVVESGLDQKHVGSRVWFNPFALGFSAMYSGRALVAEEKTKPAIFQKPVIQAVAEEDDLSDDEEVPEETLEVPQVKVEGVDLSKREEVKEQVRCKSAWLHHLTLSKDMVTERPEIKFDPSPDWLESIFSPMLPPSRLVHPLSLVRLSSS
jgi:hypothetical protein